MIVAALRIELVRLLAVSAPVKAEAWAALSARPLHRAWQLARANLLRQPLSRLVIVGHSAATPRLLCSRLGTAGCVFVVLLRYRRTYGRRALVAEDRVLHRLGQFDEPTMPMIRMRLVNRRYLPRACLNVRHMVRISSARRRCRRLRLLGLPDLRATLTALMHRSSLAMILLEC